MSAAPLPRVRGLDSIRFLCAAWVVLAHGGPLPGASLAEGNHALQRIASAALGNAFCGVAAVMAFFVISGFCIHYPFQRSLQVGSLAEYFVRRAVRILLPMAVALGLAWPVGVDLHGLIFWSLYAELIYYAAYPAALALRRRLGSWRPIVAAAYVAALGVAAAYHDAANFHDPGIALTWILGLPCWLLGCALAEEHTASAGAPGPGARRWAWRAAVWACSSACSVLRFHSTLGYVWTLPVFGLLVWRWLAAELRHFRDTAPPRALEWAGAWSYSLYLVHLVALHAAARVIPSSFPADARWPVQVAMMIAGGWIFGMLVELPSHGAAKKLAAMVRGRADSASKA